MSLNLHGIVRTAINFNNADETAYPQSVENSFGDYGKAEEK